MARLEKYLGLIAMALPFLSSCQNDGQCVSDNNCPAGQYCVDNRCVEKKSSIVECKKDSDCPNSTEVCMNNLCVDSNKANFCIDDNNCRFGMFCRKSSGDCVECLSSEQCDASKGFVCRADGTCGPHEGCSSNEECAPLYCWFETGECVDCLEPGHCKNGRVCDLSGYFCRGCHSNQDCGGAECTAPDNSAVSCKTRSDCTCANIGDCSTSADCKGQACYQGKCTRCLDMSYCGASEYCEVSTGLCKPAQCLYPDQCAAPFGCHNRQCQACTENKECRGGEICSAGLCVSGVAQKCKDNNECENGMVCRETVCQPCTDNSQCTSPQSCDLSQTPARCVDPITGEGKLGTDCTDGTDCASGLCITLAGKSFCSQFCIGSNKGNVIGNNYHRGVDCPVNYQCHLATKGSDLDGHRYCVHSSVLPDAEGYPFSSVPGSSCSNGNDHCQTSCNAATGSCRRLCKADKDCNSGEYCHAEADTLGNPTGIMSCSNIVGSLVPAGGACNNNTECRSGVCSGLCYINNSGTWTRYCNNNNDCSPGETCKGACVDVCRSGVDCPSGTICTPWMQEPLTTKNWDGDMWVNICDEAYWPTCYDDNNCDYGFECDLSTNRCGCQEDADCSATTGHCLAGVCSGLAEGEPCEDDGECASEYCSLGGKCTAICAVDADCYNNKAGHRCANVYYQNGATGEPLYAIGLCEE